MRICTAVCYVEKVQIESRYNYKFEVGVETEVGLMKLKG